MASIKEIARMCGVSPATVSYVLSGKRQMSQSVQRKVLEAAAELNYQVNPAGRALRTGRNQALGLVLPSMTNPFFPQLAEKLSIVARKQGYALFFLDLHTNTSLESAVAFLVGRGIDGLVIIPDSAFPAPLPKLSLPVVVVDQDSEEYPSVRVDDEEGGRMQARFAYEKGHTNVAYVAGPPTAPDAQRRKKGFLARAEELGLNVVFCEDSDYSLVPHDTIIEKMRRFRNDYTLIATGNDLIAFWVIKELFSMRCRIPEDVSVIGFDNNMLSDVMTPALTTVSQPLDDIGREAIGALLANLDRPGRPEKPHLVISPFLLERDSVRELPSGRS